MKKGGYKRYLDPYSDDPIPRTTRYRLQNEQPSQDNDQDRLSSGSSSEGEDAQDYLCRTEDNHDELEIFENTETLSNEMNWSQLDTMFDDNNDETTCEIEGSDVWFDAEDIHYTESSDSSTPNIDRTHDDEYKLHFRTMLCDCTSTTRGEAVMMALSIGAKHNLTWEAIIDMLSMINALFNADVVPTSKYKLFKYFPFKNDIITYHLFCTDCKQYLGKHSNLNTTSVLVCDNCDKIMKKSEFSFFLTLNFQSQLKELLEDSEIQSALMYRYQRVKKHEERLEDIYDGDIYKNMSAENKPLAQPYNFSYTFSTDGCQVSKSSRTSAWPIYAMIHELPPKLRVKHILMVSLWVSDVEPDMNLFLQQFVEEANTLSTEGVQWKLGDQLMTSRVLPLSGCFDSVARCKVLNMKQYNGYYGCTFCEHPCESINGNIRYPISTVVPEERTDDSIKTAMIEIQEHCMEENIKGVKGPSILMNLQFFDLVHGMIPDYMHSILLGVIKQYTEILLTSVGNNYYIGRPEQLLQINNRLLSIRHPSCITRSPRKIEDRHIWKASEWRSWLIFYSIICLDGILHRKYLKHLALLVSAVEILLSESLTEEMIDEADTSLIKFVALYQKYFGKIAMTYNLHLLLHMRQSVLNWGPLWTHNAFCFESENKYILQLRKSPAHISLQIVKKYLFFKSLNLFGKKISPGQNFKLFFERTLTGRLKKTLELDHCILIGNGKEYELNDNEKRLIGYTGYCKSFNRIVVNGIRYTSESYRKCRKLNDSVVETTHGQKGIITNICFFPNALNEKIVIFYKEILLSPTPFFSANNVNITHINQCTLGDNIYSCNPSFLLKQGYFIRIRNKMFFVSVPKGCYGD